MGNMYNSYKQNIEENGFSPGTTFCNVNEWQK